MHARKNDEENNVVNKPDIPSRKSSVRSIDAPVSKPVTSRPASVQQDVASFPPAQSYPEQPNHLVDTTFAAPTYTGSYPRNAVYGHQMQSMYGPHVPPLQSLPPYDRNTAVWQPNYESSPRPVSPIRYSNFPPEANEDFIEQVFPEVAGARWNGGTNDESYVRGTMNVFAQKESESRISTPNEVPSDAVNTMDGLQRWLQASQQANPVNSILKFDSLRGPLSGVLSLRSTPDTFSGAGDYRKPSPVTASGLGRYAKVEQTWYSRLSSQGRWPGVEKKWYDIIHAMSGDLFDSCSATCGVPPQGQAVRVSESCRLRMMQAIYPPVSNPYHPASVVNLSSGNVMDRFPSCEQFDTALDLYFTAFSREAPFIHRATFSISTCNPLLLFTMSCIGFLLSKTSEGTHFVQNNFNCMRDRILTELDRKLSGTTKDALSTFATSFIFLKLAALISDRDHLSPCQLLYTSLISLAQLHGFFSDFGRRTNADMFESINNIEERWLAWARVESMKRIAISLMRLDSAYATFLRSAPVARVMTINLLLPCDDKLFNARNAADWWNLTQNDNYPVVMPAISVTNSLDRLVNHTFLDYYALHAILNYLQLRSLDAYQRLLDFQAASDCGDQYVLVPYQFYATESSLQDMAVHVVAYMDSYQKVLPQSPANLQRTNCLVFWHFHCLSLTVNQDLFEIAAGREGSGAAANAIQSIATWSKTPAARRALIHSAHIHKLLWNRSDVEMSSLYAAFATFTAALVMTLYVFADPVLDKQPQPYELTSDVDWPGFGLVGLSETTVPLNNTATEHFILSGGPFLFNGNTLRGFAGARYVLTLYAELLKSCGRYNYRQMSKILVMMHDLLNVS